MTAITSSQSETTHRRMRTAALVIAIALSGGCSAFHQVRGVPATYVPREYQGPHRGDKKTIDLSLLVRTPPDQHRVAGGDVLSIYIPGVLGRSSVDFNSEVGVDPPINNPQTNDYAPTFGFPVQVRDDHTISLPQIPPVNVHGMTLHEVEMALRRAYTVDRQIVKAADEMILVSLQRPREHRILVVRQEANANATTPTNGAGSVNIGSSRRGTARVVRLRAYENDILHALSDTAGVDGLPGLDAENTIYVIRRRTRCGPTHPAYMPTPAAAPQPVPALQTSFNSVSGEPGNEISTLKPQHDQAVAVANWRIEDFSARNAQTVVLAGHTFGRRESETSEDKSPSSPVATAAWGAIPLTVPSTGPTVQFAPAQQVQYVPMPAGDSNNGSGDSVTGHTLAPMPLPVHGSPIPAAPPGHSMSSIPAAPQFSGFSPNEFDSSWTTTLGNFDPTIENPNVIKIPVRLSAGECPQLTEEDITLYDGDIVFIESRKTEVFYTGGLLGGGQYTLPRDYDLRVLEAISIAESRNANGGGGALRSVGGVSALNRDVATSASRVAILRYLPNGQRITIEVDLHKAMRYQEENILVQPGDMLILQYTFPEATSAFVQRFLLEGALIGIATSTFTGGSGG